MGFETKFTRRELLAGATAAMVVPSWASKAQLPNESLVPFRYRATDEALEDLKHRLEQTRWPERETGSGWNQGVPLAALRGLVEYWRSGYDWRRCEAELGGWPQFKTRIDGLDLHFIHVRSRHRTRFRLC